MKHWIGMAGLHGYLPQFCASFDARESAVYELSEIHELSLRRSRELKKYGCLELDLHRDGNEYIEITECECDEPEVHNDQ